MKISDLIIENNLEEAPLDTVKSAAMKLPGAKSFVQGFQQQQAKMAAAKAAKAQQQPQTVTKKYNAFGPVDNPNQVKPAAAPTAPAKPSADQFAQKLSADFKAFSDAGGSIGAPAVKQVLKSLWMQSGGIRAESKKR